MAAERAERVRAWECRERCWICGGRLLRLSAEVEGFRLYWPACRRLVVASADLVVAPRPSVAWRLHLDLEVFWHAKR